VPFGDDWVIVAGPPLHDDGRMNALIASDGIVPSTEISRRVATVDGQKLGLPTGDLRVITTGLVGREAAISAGHHALARLVTTRQIAADR
jgi:hypothetical protein